MTSHVPRSPGGGPRARSSPGHRSSCIQERRKRRKFTQHVSQVMMRQAQPDVRARIVLLGQRVDNASRSDTVRHRTARIRRVRARTYQKMRSSREPCGPGGKNQKKSCVQRGAVGGQSPFSCPAHMGDVGEGQHLGERGPLTLRVSFGSLLIGISPDQLGPTSKSTSGIVVPST